MKKTGDMLSWSGRYGENCVLLEEQPKNSVSFPKVTLIQGYRDFSHFRLKFGDLWEICIYDKETGKNVIFVFFNGVLMDDWEMV